MRAERRLVHYRRSHPHRTANEILGSGFESEDFDTIGGLVFGRLGRAPEVGYEAAVDGYTLRVEEVDGPRIVRVAV